MYVRRFLPLFVLILLCLIIISYQINKGKDLRPFHFLSTPINALNKLTTEILDKLMEPVRVISLRDKDVKRREAEIKSLLLERQQYREIFLENQRLRNILSLKEKEKRYITAAKVIARGLDPFSDIIVINKGFADGIAKDMAVITPLGLIGKVYSVKNGSSSILLISDTRFSAAVKIQETRKDAILSGNGNKGCVLKYVDYEETINKGAIVITSGFDDLFPKGLPVGYVTKVSKRESAFFQAIEVTPFQDLESIDEVIILKR